MKAIILAAGRGSRLNRRTQDKPKCLVELGGRSLLSWQIAALRAAGIQKLLVVRGYAKDCLQGGEYSVLDNLRWAETNMVETLNCASSYLRQGISLVAYSDIVYHPSIIERLIGAAGELVVVYDRLWADLWRERFEDPLADAETFQFRDGRVTSIGERASSVDQIHGQYLGLLKFSPKGWSATENLLRATVQSERDRLDMTGLLQRLIQHGIPVDAVPVDGLWCEVDSESDLELYHERISAGGRSGNGWKHDWRW